MLSVAKPAYLRCPNLRCSFQLSKQVLRSNNGDTDQRNQLSSINDRRTLLSTNQTRCFSLESAANGVVSSIVNSPVVDVAQKILISVHDSTGIPWSLEIILASFFVRQITLPTHLFENHLAYVFHKKAKPEMNEQLSQIRELTRRKLQLGTLQNSREADRFFARESRRSRRDLYIKHNIHPMRRVLCVLSPFPFWAVMSFSVGGLCSRTNLYRLVENKSIAENMIATKPQAEVEGILWFQDLTLPDQHYVLPVILALILFTSIEYNLLSRRFNFIETKSLSVFTVLMRTVTVLLIYASTTTPSVSINLIC